MFDFLTGLLGWRISAETFERRVFRIVLRRLTDASAVRGVVEAIGKLSSIPDEAKRQNNAAHHYLVLEEHIQSGQERGRIPREALREYVYTHCHPEQASGSFALLFLTRFAREVRLYERYVEALVQRAKPLLGDDGYAQIIHTTEAVAELRSVVTAAGFRWDIFERNLERLAPPEQARSAERLLRDVVKNITQRLFVVVDTVRTELILQDSYRDLQVNLDYLDDVAVALGIVPEELLKEERISLLGKSELEYELKRKSQEVEMSIAELEAEKAKLSTLSREDLEKRVTERTAKLVEALEEARRRRAQLEEFSSLATHELRTPIGIIKGYATLLLDGSTGEMTKEQKRFVAQINSTNKRLLELVNAMLNASRIELGTLAIEPQPVYLPDLADEVVKDLRAQIEEKKMVIEKQYDKKLPIIDVDPHLVHAIVQNLISNSIKYTPESGHIAITIEKKGEDALLAVSDTGYGIPADAQGKIFSKMFRADNVRTLKVEGTGLGLYIVKSVLEQAGGKIWFESPAKAVGTAKTDSEHPGTAFFITIPLTGMKKKEGIKGLS